MADSMKLAEMQRTAIEFERQRHLANWLVKSSPHMAKPTTQSTKGGSKNNGGTITQNPIFLLSKLTPSSNSLAMSRQPVFTSQTNLPLQIVTSQDGHKPKLRRFNSHDTSANMFSVADFENARLARRNELEIKQRQQRYKMNSLSSGGGDCSTGDSKGSKYSNDSNPETLPAELFLDRYSLPRAARILMQDKFSDETLQSSSSGGSMGSSAAITKKDKSSGELFLLYRHLKNRKIYHGYNTKSGTSRKKGVIIPQEFPGFFSFLNDKGVPSATLYTTLVQLVRERVYKFVSVDNLQAYTESQSTDTYPPRAHYVKITARAGQQFRLLAVFEDGKQDTGLNKSNTTSGREKEKGRYAQLLNENRQIVYVSLTAKGKFYEMEQTTPQLLQKSNSLDKFVDRQLSRECVHRISNIITRDTEFPLQLKFITGPSGIIIPDYLTITKMSTETVVISCPIEEPEMRSPLCLRKLQLVPEMRLTKCFLGFENEQKMFSNQNVQNILRFCQVNCDNFTRMVDTEQLPREVNGKSATLGNKPKTEGLKILRPLNFLRREKSMIAHEREDSIIFLTKNDLENLGTQQQEDKEDTQTISERMKVFQPTKKKWFRSSRNSRSNETLTSLDLSAQSKRMSMERYQDMSKLLLERFGGIVEVGTDETYTGGRSSSEIGVDIRRDNNLSELRQKSMSMQDMDGCRDEKPDLVKFDFKAPKDTSKKPQNESEVIQAADEEDDDKTSMTSFNNQNSFITEKLFNEFHVKTKKTHSKSSSSLHQLLHFAVPQKMNISEMKKKMGQPKAIQFIDVQCDDGETNVIRNETSIISVDGCSELVDDLPYSNVRDSLIYHRSHSGSGSETHTENIYSEICTDVQSNNGQISNVQSGHTNGRRGSITSDINGTSIRISVASANPNGFCEDNIYNTLK